METIAEARTNTLFVTDDVPHLNDIHLVLPHRLPLDQSFNLLVKRATDLIFSFLVIVLVASWLFPIIALLIKLDSKGPVLFLQKRSTKNGKLFTCFKFRTMIVNDNADSVPAAVDDKRVTGVGKFLRKNHLDELPQFFNVLLGNMSLIGPRPHMVSDNEKFAELLSFYSYRYKVKPGITGLAQVNGFVGTIQDVDAMKERVRRDIYYIHHWTLFLDAKIFCRTFIRMARVKR